MDSELVMSWILPDEDESDIHGRKQVKWRIMWIKRRSDVYVCIIARGMFVYLLTVSRVQS